MDLTQLNELLDQLLHAQEQLQQNPHRMPTENLLLEQVSATIQVVLRLQELRAA